MHKLIPISDDELNAMLDPDDLEMFRDREMSPEHRVLRGTAHNPDTFFQIREAVNPWSGSSGETDGPMTSAMEVWTT